ALNLRVGAGFDVYGLTATPKDEIDKNTYDIFELNNGYPTYGYDLAQAVKDKYLVDYISVETKMKFDEGGIVYDELPEDEKEEYEKIFEEEDGTLPEAIDSSKLNKWIFNVDTIRQVLDVVMTNGLKIDYGQKIGKTIIFAKNHKHAEQILAVFQKEYPYLKDYAKVIDNHITYAQSVIDEFSDPRKLPQIAIAVDMLDTGIDVPEVVNLVFFKKVMSKAKFWQMIGRGTRLCPGLFDGEDKDKFYIFDFCGNFEFFRMNKGKASENRIALQSAVFHLQFEICYQLQKVEYQTERLITYRNALVRHMCEKIKELPKDNFRVRQHLKYVELYSSEENYRALTFEDTKIVREEVTPLILPEKDEVNAVRFDALIYGIEVALLAGEKYPRGYKDLKNRVTAVSSVANIPEIQDQREFIRKILNTDYLERAEFYIREHQDNIVIAKLKTNKPLTENDIDSLEEILWKEIGTKQDYENEIGQKPLGEFVREIVGLDMNAAKEAFSAYLSDTNMDSRQIYFVNQIIEYIVHNGMLKDLSVLQESPFTDQGSIVDIFTDLSVWMGIRGVIDQINANAAA
ncbi:restriction endonuclease subunit R, partial [Firmicutes bacterium TM09-10]